MAKTKDQSAIVKKVSDYTSDLLSKLSTTYFYHNLKHTQQVVNSAIDLADALHLKPEEKEIVQIAAWFHDVGYIEGAENHEKVSAQMATEFLQKENYNAQAIEQVNQCILATQMGTSPNDYLEQLIKDADSAHLGKKSMQRRADLLRMEWEAVNQKKFSEEEWIKTNINFLQTHQYYTTVAQSEWGATKEKNLQRLLKAVENISSKTIDSTNEEEVQIRRSRGVETMFRVTLRNHINLSRIADNKANFLLSVSGIILSFLLGQLISDNKPVVALIWPTLYFLVVCVITMILAILATRPNVTKGTFSREGLTQKKSNILFFGNFHAMPLEEFTWGINKLMQEDDLLYDSLTKDLYYLGKVLHKKYKYLRFAFSFFMFGIISSSIFYATMLLIRG